MRYVEGKPLHHFLSKNGPDWLGLVGLGLLEKLRTLHECGFVFGDLKPENVMVSKYGEVELIDFGGTSPIGRSVKQFTEWHDRGFWNAGSRISDEGYDLFAFAVLCLRLLNEEGLKRQPYSCRRREVWTNYLSWLEIYPTRNYPPGFVWR